jgi:hypothetical protein
MKTSNLIKLTVVTGTLMAVTAKAGIVGSKHDFSQWTFNNNPADPNTVCAVCHTPHHADPNSGPLWGHQSIDTSGWKMYGAVVGVGPSSSPGASIKFTPLPAPNPSSLACLSCHDGTVAINAYGSPANSSVNTPVFVSGSAAVSQDQGLNKNLSHSHPISFNYQSVVGVGPTKDQWIYDQNSPVLVPDANSPLFTPGADMSIKGFLLDSQGNLECSSCHDVHAQEGSAYDPVLNPKLVKINGTRIDPTIGKEVGSLLCRSCHNK